VLGSSDAARTFFNSNGLRTSDRLSQLSPDTHTVVIWNAARLSEDEKRSSKALCDFAARGGRVIVLSTPTWSWSELCDMKIGEPKRFSRVFPYKPTTHPLSSVINPEWLIRWNGFPGAVGLAPLEGSVMAHAEKLLWARDPNTTVAATLPVAEGRGRILFAQLHLQDHVDPSKSNCDPAAERLLLVLLTGESKQ
jgi:hypothetical protein